MICNVSVCKTNPISRRLRFVLILIAITRSIGIADNSSGNQSSRSLQWPSPPSARRPSLWAQQSTNTHFQPSIPMHILSPGPYAASSIRAYSFQAGDGREVVESMSERPSITQGDPIQDEPRTPVSRPRSTADSIVTGLGFQSLSALFPQPRGGRYSSARTRPTGDAEVTSQSSPSDGEQIHGDSSPLAPSKEQDASTKPSAETSNLLGRASYSLFASSRNTAPIADKTDSKPNGSLSSYFTGAINHGTVRPYGRNNARIGPRAQPETITSRSRREQSVLQQEDEFDDVALIDRPWGISRQTSPGTRRPLELFGRESNKDSPLLEQSSLQASSTPVQDSTEPRRTTPALTHVNKAGEAHMVDVGGKKDTKRIAVAWGLIRFSNPEASTLISENTNKKGDVLGTARIAGIMAAKRCAELIPLCHPIALSKVTVDVRLQSQGGKGLLQVGKFGAVEVEATVQCQGPTGVEMEALTAVSVTLLTVYDMCKAVDRRMNMRSHLVYKHGGKGGIIVDKIWENHNNPVAEK